MKMRYIKIYVEQCKLSVMSAAMYRANFWLMLIQSFINTAMGILCIEFIYGSVDSIAGWGKGEMLILICTAMVVNQLFRNLIHWNQNRFVRAIGSGGLDKMLLRPISLIFQANTGRVDISGIISITAPAVVLIYQIFAAGININAVDLGLYILFLLNGVLILSSFMLLLYSSAFIFIHVDGLDNIYYILMDIAEKPEEMFSRNIYYGFLFLIPAMPIANAPVSILLGKGNWFLMLVNIGIGLLFAAASYAALQLGLRRYTSASS